MTHIPSSYLPSYTVAVVVDNDTPPAVLAVAYRPSHTHKHLHLVLVAADRPAAAVVEDSLAEVDSPRGQRIAMEVRRLVVVGSTLVRRLAV